MNIGFLCVCVCVCNAILNINALKNIKVSFLIDYNLLIPHKNNFIKKLHNNYYLIKI